MFPPEWETDQGSRRRSLRHPKRWRWERCVPGCGRCPRLGGSVICRDGIEFAMVRFNCIQNPACGKHAVPGAIRLEIVGLRIRYGVTLLEGTEIGNLCPSAVRVDPDYAVVRSRKTV